MGNWPFKNPSSVSLGAVCIYWWTVDFPIVPSMSHPSNMNVLVQLMSDSVILIDGVPHDSTNESPENQFACICCAATSREHVLSFLRAEQSYTGTEAYSPLVIILEVSPQVISHHGKNSAKRQGDVSRDIFDKDSFYLLSWEELLR